MNILVISDLHLGKKDLFDTFGWDEDEFIYFLNTIIDYFEVKLVILNGDIYEMLKYSLDEIKSAYPKIIKFFDSQKFIKIRGNHDFFSDEGLDYYQIKNSKGQIIHIEHGHNADFINGTQIGRLISNLSFKILKFLTKNRTLLNFYYKIIEFDDQINRIPRKYNSIKYLHYALKVLRDVDMAIFGHTHKIEFHKTYYLNKKKKYLNCGSCSLGRFQGVIINTETLKYETLKLNKKSKRDDFLEQIEGNIIQTEKYMSIELPAGIL